MNLQALINSTAQKHGIDSALFAAMINQESAGNPNARSKVGAMGLGQLMPATAKELGVTDPYDPNQNINASAKYLKQQLDTFGGNPALALAAYNAGAGNVKKYGGIPPFKETQNYVKKILGALNPISEAQASEQPYQPTREEWLAMRNNQVVTPAIEQEQNAPSREEFMAMLKKQSSVATGAWDNQDQGALPSVGKMVENFIPDIVNNVIPGAVNAVIHPIDTTQGLLNIANSGLQQILPESINNLMPESTRANKNIVPAIGEALKPYINNPKLISRAIENNPAQALGMLSAVGGIAGKVAGLPKLSAAASAVDPLNMVGGAANAVLSKAPRAVGNVLAEVISGAGTHTGADSIREAAKAGLAGGKAGKTFIDNMRGNVPLTNVVDDAVSALNDMKAARSSEYINNIQSTSNDAKILSLRPIKKELGKAYQSISYNGVTKNQSASNALDKIGEEIKLWNSLPQDRFHTPMGLDALKQRIHSVVETIPQNERTAHKFASDVERSIKNEIVKQSPDYAKTMTDYSEASDSINEIQKALSLGDKATADQSLRKLQKAMRNNVNTSYGNNISLTRSLDDIGGGNIMPALAGQAMNSWMPRGIANALYGGGLAGAGYLGGIPGAAIAAGLQSPRLIGEAAFKIGQAGKLVNKTGAPKLLKALKDLKLGQQLSRANLINKLSGGAQ